ncbi:PDZ domain-containing protein [Campylobacter fetus]|uniref:PDZ domain-containing protein n=1 Tax=Campylobacter fetus TaxID=196 RepID=UPI000A97B646|nr:PDZ domain-containing protein [Campylobacter fetus]
MIIKHPRSKPKKPVKKRTFLSQYGITLNPNLTIKSVARNSKAYKAGFRNGDKIMQIDKKQLNSSADIEKIMSAKNGAFYYLVSRDDFQFFVKVYR